MIDELHVCDVALIHDATIEPASGLTVLTGETGTGKTALLSAIKLLVGERADASSVREGAAGLTVEGRLFLPESGPAQSMAVLGLRLFAAGMIPCCLNNMIKNMYQATQRVYLTEWISVLEGAALPVLA